jgi:predicted metallo-beta-lactamase superfamily hydrolase
MGLRVVPLAFDSMGVRSQATLVETPDLRAVIDPGVALGPTRYGLPPHPLELRREEELRARVFEEARRADVLAVSHYHHDHFDPFEPGLAEGKVLYLKHPAEAINRSQRGRAAEFLKRLGRGPKKIEFADGRSFRHGETSLTFSPPVFHGTDDRLGYVVEVCVEHGGERMVFASDVEGPPRPDQFDFMLRSRPDLLLVDGPMTYMLGYRYSQEALDASVAHLCRLVKETEVETLVADHHFLRDAGYAGHLRAVREVSRERGVRVLTAAEFAGRRVEPLEALRRELYRKEPAERVPYTRFEEG